MRLLRSVPAFLSVLVFLFATPLLSGQNVPTPESVLGFEVGADFHLATYEQSLDYFQRLDAASDRLELVEVGRTSFGRPWYLALISSAENPRTLWPCASRPKPRRANWASMSLRSLSSGFIAQRF